jgi:hypothetical protein
MNPPRVDSLLRFSGAVSRDRAIAQWFREQPAALRAIARHWFARMRDCGTDVRELLHDDRPTVCVGDAPFAYVDAFSAHVNVGFFHGASLADPAGLLEGTGRYMRHVKLRPGRVVDAPSLEGLVFAAYQDVRARLTQG